MKKRKQGASHRSKHPTQSYPRTNENGLQGNKHAPKPTPSPQRTPNTTPEMNLINHPKYPSHLRWGLGTYSSKHPAGERGERREEKGWSI